MARAEVEGIKREAGIERESRIAVLFIVRRELRLRLCRARSVRPAHGAQERTWDRPRHGIAVSVLTILLSWLLIHTVFALFYAHEFHSEGKGGARGSGGGLDFPDDATPDYLDFLYFSFVVGTTAQTPTWPCARAPCAAW